MAIKPNSSLPAPNEAPGPVQNPVPVVGTNPNTFTGYPNFPNSGLANQKIVQDLQSAVNQQPAPKTGGQATLSVSENTPAAQQGDSQLWKVAVTITNLSPPVQPVFIPANYIHELVLEHSLVDPCYWKGSMIVTSNRFGAKEGENIDDNINLEMLFRGDGKDEMLVQILPLFGGSVELPPETWNIESEFIIYDTEDIPWNNGAAMAKKVYFWHKAYNLMLERGSPYSTAYYAGLSDITKATNEDRMLPVGKAIKTLLESADLGNYIDYDEWDDGAPTSKIFYSSSADKVVLNSLLELLPYYVSTDGGPGFFYFNRGKNKFQLISLKKFFENAGSSSAGQFYYETFEVGTASTGTLDKTTSPRKTPTFQPNPLYSLYLKKYFLIKDNSYVITEPAGSDSMEFAVSHMIHTYDHKNKKFVVNYKDSEIKNIKSNFETNYTDKLLPGATGFPLFTLNSAKKNQARVNQRYESSVDKALDTVNKVGKNYMTLGGLLLNMAINFRVQGSTHRHAGRFVGLDKQKTSDNKYDFRMLGEWFVTSVITRWQKGQLYNEIVGNKVSSFENLRFNEDV